MKDHRFIELVNLYIDRQITADETAELETEIQHHPRRRAVYRQYCQMHRATTLVYDSFRAQAPGQPPAEPAARSTIAFFESRQRGRRYRWAYYASGLAAAACLALVFAQLNPKVAIGPDTVVATESQSATLVATTAPLVQPDSTVHDPDGLTVGPVSMRNATEPDYAALLAALRQEEQRNGQIPMPSLFEDGVFEAQQVLPSTNQRTFRSRQTPAQQAEFAAFQFQR